METVTKMVVSIKSTSIMKRMRKRLKPAFVRLYSYSLILVAIWLVFPLLENRVIYHPEVSHYKTPLDGLKATYPALLPKVRDVYFESLDGTRLNGWYVPPKGNKPLIIYAHGNGGNMGDRTGVMHHAVQRGYGFFMFDYRGYGLSKGSPSEKGLYKDFEAASNFVSKRYGIPRTRQIAMGGSLGSAVVTDVASRLPFRQVVLFAAFTSGAGYARTRLGPLPYEFLIRQQYDSYSKIASILSPLIIVHGEKDAMMPVVMADALYNRAESKNKKLIRIKDAGHDEAFFRGGDDLFAAIEKNERALAAR